MLRLWKIGVTIVCSFPEVRAKLVVLHDLQVPLLPIYGTQVFCTDHTESLGCEQFHLGSEKCGCCRFSLKSEGHRLFTTSTPYWGEILDTLSTIILP